MRTTKTTKTIYWTTTGIIFLFEMVMPAFTSHTDLAVEGIRHLGYPDYFRVMLPIFKVVGTLALVLPFVTGRFKEWVYAGFSFTIISAFISHGVVDGFNRQTYFPLLIFAVLSASYLSYPKLSTLPHSNFQPSTSNNYVVSSLPG